jgi:two-component system response regulator HydG
MSRARGAPVQSNILLIDDDPGLRDLLEGELKARGHAVFSAPSAEDGLRLLHTERFDAVLTDVNLGGMTGVAFCDHARTIDPDLPIIVMTAYGTTEAAVGAIRGGAYDFVTKPFDFEQVLLAIDRALALRSLRREVVRLRSSVREGSQSDVAPAMLGKSAVLDRVRDLISRVAESDATVLVTGESGTGKELVARAIHDSSARKDGPFVAINCAAMPESLLESELFGHARGAFTDAKTARAGLFLRAGRGTILLDEIGEMPAGMQAKLLRAVQERRVRPVGADEEVAFDARIIAATHRDLEEDVREKRFREDLYYRINVVKIQAPPLRARGNDTLLLAQRFIDESPLREARGVEGMSVAFAKKLLEYPWPGNIRQLQNCIERAIAVSRGRELSLEDLPDNIRDAQPSHVDLIEGDDSTSLPTMEEVERRYIRQVLKALGGNKTAVAQVLGVDRRTLYRKLERMDEATG